MFRRDRVVSIVGVERVHFLCLELAHRFDLHAGAVFADQPHARLQTLHGDRHTVASGDQRAHSQAQDLRALIAACA